MRLYNLILHPNFMSPPVRDVIVLNLYALASAVYLYILMLLISVDSTIAGQTATVRATAGLIQVVKNGAVAGEHIRQFGRDKTIYDPWHYLGVLERKPGALRNGAPFQGWGLPPCLQQSTPEGKSGALASRLARVEFVVLDELGHLPFSKADGALLRGFPAAG